MIRDAIKDTKKTRVARPRCHLKVVSTGIYNYRSLGIRHIRRLNPSRGGREGNNAFVKDLSNNSVDEIEDTDIGSAILYDVAFSTIKTLNNKDNSVCDEHVLIAVERGHYELAAQLIEHLMRVEKLGCSFSKFHLESLTKTDKSATWDPPIREASAKKPSNDKLTPLHTACINPSIKALEEVYGAYPDIYVSDRKGRRAVHFAAAASTTAPLEFLISKGAVVQDATKDGVTPLIMACIAGRPDNVDLIIKTLRNQKTDGVDESYVKKFGTGGIDMPERNSWCPLHHAIIQGILIK